MAKSCNGGAMRRLLAFSLVTAFLTVPTAVQADTVPFNYVGAAQSWAVPAGVTQATFDLYGAQGGGTDGGKAAHVRTTITVTPGETLFVYVGGTGGLGAKGFNGGGAGGSSDTPSNRGYGGGGGTDVRRGGSALSNRLMVAAGGGGSAVNGDGGNSGQDGKGESTGGKAATSFEGGAGGGSGNKGSKGELGAGGAGFSCCSNVQVGGGGGGGLYGGGGGAGDIMGYDGGGGGGSSLIARSDLFILPGALLEDGARSGNGTATVTPVTSTAGGQGTSGLVDTVKPKLGALSFSRSSFAAARSGASTSAKRKGKAKKKPVGTKVSYSLSEPGSVRFRVERKARGRKVGRRCVAPKRSNRKKAKCTRWTAVRGSFTVAGKAGRNSFTFRGRVGGKALRRGTYRLVGVATDGAKNASTSVKRTFKII